MADIISIEDRLKLARNERDASVRRRKVSAMRKAFQCTQSALECRKCGESVESDYEDGENGNYSLRVPYHLCGTCAEEYVNFIEWLKGKRNPDRYWHNEGWVNVWSKWIDYQHANDNYVKSREFRQLLHELEETGFEE